MLYDSKWDKIFTDWVSKIEPTQKYDYGNTQGKCVIAQFSDYLGPECNNWRSDEPVFYNRLFRAATGYPRTMGAAHRRFITIADDE